MFLGILSGLATCALWGATFVAPRMVVPFTSWDLAVARYGLFGLTSLALMLLPRFRPRRLTLGQLVAGFLLGAVAAPGYFVAAAYAVRFSGAAVPPLVVGLAPAFLAVVANRRDGSLPWRVLALPLTLIVVGLGVVNLDVLWAAGPARGEAPLLGLALSLVALASWIAFGFVNAAVMQGRNAPDGLHWTGLQGLGAGVGALLLLPTTSAETTTTASQSVTFWGWVVLMGIAGSWVATWCWVVASRRLPLALLSQLIVAETIFGLLYGFVYERRLPTSPEWVGSLLQLAGVALAIGLFSRPEPRGTQPATCEEVALP